MKYTNALWLTLWAIAYTGILAISSLSRRHFGAVFPHKLYETESRSSVWKTRTTFQTKPRAAGNTKGIANKIWHTENIQ